MKRKAILIESSNVKGQSELPGAKLDIENWRKFLTSDLGGAWGESEIISLSKPFTSDLEKHLQVEADCYCFVAFSGHGSNGSVVLNDHFSSYPIASLRPKCKRGTLIVDACRGVEDATNFSFGIKRAFINESNSSTVALNALEGKATVFASAASSSSRLLLNRATIISNHKSIWEKSLASCGTGVIDMLACSKGEAAGENPTAGGYYTMLLLQSADLWIKTASRAGMHTTKEAHDYAHKMLPPQQRPEYSPTWLYLPFAVNA